MKRRSSLVLVFWIVDTAVPAMGRRAWKKKKLLPSCAIKGKSTYTIPSPDVAGLHPYTLFVFAIGAPNGSVWPPTIFRVRVRVRVKTSCIISVLDCIVYELLVERVQRVVLGPCML